MNCSLLLFVKSLQVPTQHMADWTPCDMSWDDNEHLEKIVLFPQMIANWGELGALSAAY